MIPRFGVVLAVLTVVRAADISLVASPSPMKQGDNVTFTCTIPPNIKSWQDLVRFVRQIDKVDYGIATNGDKQGKFADDKRYSITYDDMRPTKEIVVTLTITNIEGRDGGHVGCLLLKEGTSTYSLGDYIVQVPVQDVTVSLDGGEVIPDGGKLAFNEGSSAKAVCVVRLDGTDLPPKTTILIDGNDVTAEAKRTNENPVRGQKDGYMALTYDETWEYTLKPEDGGKTLTCKSETAKELGEVSKTAQLQLNTALTVDCGDKVNAEVGSENVVLTCTVTGSPLPTDSTWTWTHGGHAMTLTSSASEKDGYKAELTNSDEKTAELKLTIPKVDAGHFHSYGVEVSNAVGAVKKEIELAEASESAATTPPTTTIKPSPQPTYVHVTEKPKEKEGPKEAQSTSTSCPTSPIQYLSMVITSAFSFLFVGLI